MYPFREGSFAVRNGWYVAAFVNELGRTLVSRTVLGQPVVLYRKEDGTAVAVGGRCPHRHFPLGESCLKGDTIVCGYHGIAFDSEGTCVDIPSQDHIPKRYRIPTFPLVEHGMWAWIWMGDPDRADEALLPDLEEIGLCPPYDVQRPFYFHEVACRYQLLNDNLTDLSHLAFLHGTNIGTLENASEPEELEKKDRFLSSRRHIVNAPVPPLMKQVRNIEGDRLDRTIGIDFYAPCLHVGVTDIRYPQDHPTRAGETIATSRVFHAVTPSTPRSTLYFFGMAAPDQADVDALEVSLKPVLEEDIFASVEIEKMIDLYGGTPPDEYMIRSDTNAVEGRRMLQALMDEERETIATR